MMDSITVGAKIRMTEAVTGDYPVGSTATILYIDEMDNVFMSPGIILSAQRQRYFI